MHFTLILMLTLKRIFLYHIIGFLDVYVQMINQNWQPEL
jgi:hypothetical protein